MVRRTELLGLLMAIHPRVGRTPPPGEHGAAALRPVQPARSSPPGPAHAPASPRVCGTPQHA
ncbi:hypothetical protein GCM10025782_22170 [Pedococcus ginsenosidimutans]|uniref:Uncharacterized protein n=1 Tax=Pedococcus ginsenosidimutans TaxID=490570 RepID=A0ABP8Y9A4_9MICO